MTKKLTLFNFAALPVDPVFSAMLTAYAQKNFRSTARGYLLGLTALPHMTLCFFRAEDEDTACQIVHGIPCFPEKNMTVTTSAVYCRNHIDQQFSTGLLIQKTQQLQDYQAEVRSYILKAGGFDVLPVSESYWPHFTCAFTSVADIIQTTDIPPWARGDVAIRPGLGISDEAGQFVREIKRNWML